ncbi:hypothetical protein Taro_043126 [Colocasia esculenta]|uniref:Protein LOW PSII ACCUMULATION 2, chloroplastic n=1 Tax=Colocasia esculenta TaxID=4460 RepID=A0A843X010_COLES|nr:hypothetical protein [Colocasia esculenta]
MEAASAVALRHPPPRPHLFSRKPPSLAPLPSSSLSVAFPTLAAFSSRVLQFTARAEPPDAGDVQGSPEGPPTPAASEPSPLPNKPTPKGAGAGFGSGVAEPNRKKCKQRGPVVRRVPVQTPSSLYSRGGGGSLGEEQRQQQTVSESAFLLTWLGLGLLILIEGVALAASGFLPEQWDNFFVKYLYPSFTPTVFVFVGGTVAYGVLKYLQGEKQNN